MNSETISATSVNQFKNNLKGLLLQPGDEGYDDCRSIWNGMIDHRPSLIVCCENVQDVIASVHFAKENGLPVSVKGGGHGVAGKAVCNDGLMIDFSRMNAVTVDPTSGTAIVQPGAKLGDLDRESSKRGLLTTGGIVSSTGVAGLTLGGGIGYLARKYGLALDNVISLDVITADGNLLHCSKSENTDLFWALRGGGGNFGVVVSFEFQLYKENTNILTAQIFYPMNDARTALIAYRDLMKTAPDELSAYGLIASIPPVEAFPEELHGTPVCFFLATYAGNHDDGRKLLEPFKNIGNPIMAVVDPLPYEELQKNFDAGVPKGQRYYWKHHLMNQLSDEAIDVFLSFARNKKGPLSLVGFEPLGGAISKVPKDHTAFTGRDANFALGIWTGWMDPSDDDEIIGWAREFYEAMKPFASGGYYSNYFDKDDDSEIADAYGKNYNRLQQVKNKYDPNNFFNQNFNIKSEN